MKKNNTFVKVKKSARFLLKTLGSFDNACVLGTGFELEKNHWKVNKKIDISELPYFPITKNSFHEIKFFFAEDKASNKILFSSGRIHYYDGHNSAEVSFIVILFYFMGIKNLILTSAVGGINKKYNVGDLILVTDHVNFSMINPLIELNNFVSYERFPSLIDVYCPKYIKLISKISKNLNIILHKGILGFFPGPSYETKAELRFLEKNGIDAIGWSLVPETIVAAKLNLNVIGLLRVTDISNPKTVKRVSLDEIKKSSQINKENFSIILSNFISQL